MSKDEQLLGQVYDLQRELVANQHKIKFYESAVLSLKRNTEKSKISIKELENLKGESKTYKPLGKAFILKDKTEIQNDLAETIKNNEKEIAEQLKFRSHFEGKQKDLENQIKELVQGIKG